MGGHARFPMSGLLLVLCLGLGSCASAEDGGDPPAETARPGDAELNREQYRDWVQRYSVKSLEAAKLVITVVEDDKKVQWRESVTTHHCYVSASGAVSYRSFTCTGVKGGSGHVIPPADLERLNQLLAKLPGDGSRLPPAGRRVLLQVADDTRPTVRVYDRANAPDEVLEILRLSASGITAWLPEIPPKSEIEARPFEHGGFLCLSPDGAKILFTCMNGPLQFWEPVTHETLGEVRMQGVSQDAITFSPDGSLAVVGRGAYVLVETKTWKKVRTFEEPWSNGRREPLSHPQFTPDGKYLVLRCGESLLRVFDTHTWNRVGRLPDVPEDAVLYLPAPKKRLAVVQTRDTAILLWDLARHAAVAPLDKGCQVIEAAFSPDESMLAVVTRGKDWRSLRLRVWKVDTGALVHELRHFEQTDCETMRNLLWTPDSRYVLAATKGFWIFAHKGISVWNAKSGRHRGELTAGEAIGMAILPDGSELVAGSSDGHIRFWDFAAAMKRIRDFEESLSSP